jgi:hypothetical protein
MWCPILAAILENSDIGEDLDGWTGWLPERRRRDWAGDLDNLDDTEEIAAWNSAVRSIPILNKEVPPLSFVLFRVGWGPGQGLI